MTLDKSKFKHKVSKIKIIIIIKAERNKIKNTKAI